MASAHGKCQPAVNAGTRVELEELSKLDPAGTRTRVRSVQIYGLTTRLGARTRPSHFQLLGPSWGHQQDAACAVLHVPATDVWRGWYRVMLIPMPGNRRSFPAFQS